MPSTFVDTPQFPTVPPLPGVPPLNLDPRAIFAQPVGVISDAVGLGTLGRSGRWGIYSQSGQPVLVADSVMSMEYSRDYRVSDYPQENGAFASYNKVKTPYQAKLTFLIGTNRGNFLQQAEKAVASLALVSVVTPEIVYASANLIHLGYRRTAIDGVTLLSVDIWCEEIRVVSSGSLSNGQSPNAASPQSDGVVQPKEASVQTSSSSAADSRFATPTGLSVGIPASTPPSPTDLSSSLSGEFGTKIVTEQLIPGQPNIATVQPGLPILAPDVAISRTGQTQIVPIP